MLGDGSARQHRRPRGVGAVSMEVEAKRRGQGLVLSGSEHRGERDGVKKVRV